MITFQAIFLNEKCLTLASEIRIYHFLIILCSKKPYVPYIHIFAIRQSSNIRTLLLRSTLIFLINMSKTSLLQQNYRIGIIFQSAEKCLKQTSFLLKEKRIWTIRSKRHSIRHKERITLSNFSITISNFSITLSN